MKLSLMCDFVSTLNESRESGIANNIALKWFQEVDSVKYIRASANFLIEIKVAEQKYILRCNSVSERSPEMVADEVRVLQFLGAKDVHVCQPILSLHKRYVEIVPTELGDFVAIVYPKISGKHLESEDMNNTQYQLWGAKLGELHKTMAELAITELNNRPSWRVLMDFVKHYIANDEDFLVEEYEDLSRKLTELPTTEQTFGLIHFDFETDNLLWENEEIAIIDFDDSAKMWYVADILYALRDIFKNKEIDLDNGYFKMFIKGYQSQKDLDPEMLQKLPLFARLHRLFLISRLRRSLDITDFSNRPEWVRNLTNKVQQNYISKSLAEIKAGVLHIH